MYFEVEGNRLQQAVHLFSVTLKSHMNGRLTTVKDGRRTGTAAGNVRLHSDTENISNVIQ